MAETYDIVYEGKPVGTAQVEKQGLYCTFSCRCRLPEEGFYRIHAVYADKREDLGICVPLGADFGMDKKISIKRLGEGKPSFELLPKDWQPEPVVQEPESQIEEMPTVEEPIVETEEPIGAMFVPVTEEEPFPYLEQLEHAVLEVREEEAGILISE